MVYIQTMFSRPAKKDRRVRLWRGVLPVAGTGQSKVSVRHGFRDKVAVRYSGNGTQYVLLSEARAHAMEESLDDLILARAKEIRSRRPR